MKPIILSLTIYLSQSIICYEKLFSYFHDFCFAVLTATINARMRGDFRHVHVVSKAAYPLIVSA